MATSTDEWVAMLKEFAKLIEEAKRNAWLQILMSISESYDLKQTWVMVHELSWSEVATSGKVLQYNGYIYMNCKVKASAFIQVYVPICGRKSDKPFSEALLFLCL